MPHCSNGGRFYVEDCKLRYIDPNFNQSTNIPKKTQISLDAKKYRLEKSQVIVSGF
jgi:hypothetical protein